MKREVSIFWFRRDLRLDDNRGLYFALKSPYPVLPVFIFDPEILGKLCDKQDRRVAFIFRILKEINSKLKKNGSSLCVLHDTVDNAFRNILDQYDVKQVFTNHDYEPYALERDAKITKLFIDRGVAFHTFKDQVIFERSEIMKTDGLPYTVFTPYSNKWKEHYLRKEAESFPSEKNLNKLLSTDPLVFPSLKSIGFEDINPELPLLDLSEKTITNYHETRNFPCVNGTSHASVYLRFGTLSVRTLVRLASKWNKIWLNELIWREFFMMILFHFPYVVDHSYKKKYDNIPWRNNEKEFKLWCKGETGYPIVDAGMRQLNETGWMHNRVRMIVAGFLTKHLTTETGNGQLAVVVILLHISGYLILLLKQSSLIQNWYILKNG
jgi:deoxyribodipyrimidine photo-lyase